MLTDVAGLPPSECRAVVPLGSVVDTGTDVEEAGVGVLLARRSVGALTLGVTSDVSDVTVGMVEEVAARIEVSGLATVEGINEEETGKGVRVGISAGIEAVFVWLRNRAAL